MQSKLDSFLESVSNVVAGIVIAFFFNLFLAYMTGVSMDAGQNLEFVFGFSLMSLVRQYIIRRFFNRQVLRQLHIRVFVRWLKWRLRDFPDGLCYCGGMESCCGSHCRPGSFMPMKWYIINDAVIERFGAGTQWQ